MKEWLMVLSFCGFTAILAACNTMAGFGKDMQEGGKAIEEEAEENR